MSNIYTVTVKEKILIPPTKTSLYIDLPKELMDKLNWKKGEKLVWEETEVLGDTEDYLAAYVCRKIDWDTDIKPMFEEKMNKLDCEGIDISAEKGKVNIIKGAKNGK